MKTVSQEFYQCEKCNEQYTDKEQAEKCEARAITEDKGVKKGDVILITRGDGSGNTAVVTSTHVKSMTWGHYAAKRYWHTVGVVADLITDWGSRSLTYDDYEVQN